MLYEPRWLTPLVDRTEEFSKIKAAFEDALTRKSLVLALHGEAGVGKTRLLRETATYAQLKGAFVLRGRAAEEKLPYAPWMDVMRDYAVQLPPDLLRRRLDLQVSETGTFVPRISETFASLVPDIASKLGGIASYKPPEDPQGRIRLYETITQFVISICKEKPLLILLDDMQWADQASLGLLEHFARGSRNQPILTVCSYRRENVGTESPLYKTLMELNRERLLETISMRNLDNQDTMELIAEVFGETEISREFSDLIYERTGGNPFFVEEVLRSLVEDKAIFRTDKGWDRKPIKEIQVPESVKSTLRSRLAKLDPAAKDALAMAAVAGSEFEFDVLREVTQLQENELLEKLENAIAAGIISEVPVRKDVFRFADNRIGQMLLSELIQSRRMRYHAKIAEAMLKVYSKNIESHAELLASHFSESGDIEQTIKYSIMAGDRNRTIHAYEQAINDYERALHLVTSEADRNEEKARILETLAACHYYAGRLQNSKQCYEEALALWDKLSDSNSCARILLQISRIIPLLEPGATYRAAFPALQRGLEYLKSEPESFEAASIYSELAWYHALYDEWGEAEAWANRAMEIGNKTYNFGAVGRAITSKAALLTDTGRIEEGLPILQQALESSLQHQDYETAISSLNNLGLYTYPTDLPKARNYTVRLLDLTRQIKSVVDEASALEWLSFLDWFKGDWNNTVEEFGQGLEIEQRVGSSNPPYIWRALYSLSFGDLEQAEADLEKFSERLKPNSKTTAIVWYHLFQALLQLEHGRDDEARKHLEIGVDAFKDREFTTYPLHHVETLLHLTSIYARDHELGKARQTSDWASRLAERLRSDAGQAMALQAEASIMVAEGNIEGAKEAYLKCLALWEKAGWPYYRAKALAAYGDVLAANAPEESQIQFEQAAEIFRKLGAKRDLERTLAKLSAR